MYRRYMFVLLVLSIFTPLGLIAEGTAWGEWGADEMQSTLGFVPEGIKRFGEWWQALFPDYSMEFLGESLIGQSAGYIFSALLGSLLIYIASSMLTRYLLRQKKKEVY